MQAAQPGSPPFPLLRRRCRQYPHAPTRHVWSKYHLLMTAFIPKIKAIALFLSNDLIFPTRAGILRLFFTG
jgi:hypothetical protein